MSDPIISCSSWQELFPAINSACSYLSIEPARRLHRIASEYWSLYGIEGTYERMNGRAVSEIFAEHAHGNVNVVASGEVDGVRYELFGSPSDHIEGHEAGSE